MKKTLVKVTSKAEWAPHERAFYDMCVERGWKVEADSCGSPILRPARTNDLNDYKVGSWGENLCDVCITGNTKATVTKIKNRLQKAKVDFIVHAEGNSEAILIFNIGKLPRVVKTLNLRKKKKHQGATAEQLALARAKIKKK